MPRAPLVPLLLSLAAAAAAEDGMRLLFADEFETPGPPDPAKWSYEVGPSLRNNEAQYYTDARPENARVADGHLVITGRKEDHQGSTYTSASLTTEKSFAFAYGLVEVRARLPRGRGTWPAIWTLGADIREVGWPLCGEIDIMEHVGFDQGRVHTTVHTEAFNHTKGTQRGHSTIVADASEEFHVYAVDWRPDGIRWLLDGVETFAYPNDGKGRESWPFDTKQYLLINLAIGGAWGGAEGIDDAALPAEYRIDWVRVHGR